VDAGVAERIRFGRARADQIGTALDRVLTQPGYRAAAERVAASFKAAGGADAAARHLVELAGDCVG
jgi:UDP:flavonoid glycosyltransferase YjiC (YdhE family)